MTKIKLVYIISNIDKALAFEWIATQLSAENFELSFILLNPKEDSNLELFLKNNNVEVLFIPLNGKKSYPLAFLRVLFCLFKIKPDVVHTHLFDANLLGLTSAYLTRVKKRLYTRHYATLQHEYYPNGVKYDLLCNRLATKIVSISGATDYALTQLESVPLNKIEKIPHGFDLSAFQSKDLQKIEALRIKYGLKKETWVVGVIARYTHLKGHQYIIEAFSKYLEKYPDSCLVLANAVGDYEAEIKKMLHKLPHKNYVEIKFEPDCYSLYHLFNTYIHVPINAHIEGFGQTYIEAMAAGIPSIFTKSGIGNDVCQDSRNCIVVDYKNSEEIYSGLIKLTEDKSFYSTISINAPKSVINYDLQYFIKNLEDLYLKV
jgi:glycosyltransferase involved in cell wall biosynthesis